MKLPSTNAAASQMDSYITKAISQAARRNPNACDLSLGEPWFGPPEIAVRLIGDRLQSGDVRQALRSYGESRGTLALREAISARYKQRYDLKIDADREVVVTSGGASGFATVLLTVTEPGDEVLIFEPAYMLYERSVRLLGRIPRRIVKTFESGFSIDPDRVRDAITNRSRLLVINSPENPTGAVVSMRILTELAKICAESGLILLHDEVYDDFVYDTEHLPARSCVYGNTHTILLNSFSKRYGLLGLRLGWIIAPKEIAAAGAKVHDYLALSVNGLAEQVGTALLQSREADDWVAARRGELRSRRDLLLQGLAAVEGVRVPSGLPSGGLFIFADVDKFAETAPLSRRHPSGLCGRTAAGVLMEDLEIAVVPGDVYGASCSGCIRLVFAVDSECLETAALRLQQYRGS